MGEPDVLLTQFAVLAAISLPACAYLAYVRLTRGCFLTYTQRWPVPWGAVGAVLAVSFLLLGLLSLLEGEPPQDKLAEFSSSDYVQQGLLSFVVSAAFVGAIGWFLTRTTGASSADLGLPSDSGTWRQDIGIGILTALAALLPVYSVNALLVFVLGMESGHPTLELILADPDPMVFVAAFLTAGVAGPVFEEFVFRLLFQGWLERVEDESLGLAGRLAMEKTDEEEEQEDDPEDAAGPIEQVVGDPDNPYASPATEQVRRLRRRTGNPPTPPEITIAGLPHGWGPILISSFVFALVHINLGAAPVPLFILALMLGYLYQRTHRITPGIACHMAFNIISLVVTWVQAQTS